MKIFTGHELKMIRKTEGKTQKEMADFFNVSRGTYSCWESRYKHKPVPKRHHLVQFHILNRKYCPKINVFVYEKEENKITKFIKSLWRRLWRK